MNRLINFAHISPEILARAVEEFDNLEERENFLIGLAMAKISRVLERGHMPDRLINMFLSVMMNIEERLAEFDNYYHINLDAAVNAMKENKKAKH